MKRFNFKKVLHFLISLLPYLIVFTFALYTPSDPDLGWHLKYGEYFVQNGTVLRDNTFSTLMPDYQWANTSWLTDVITYLTFNAGGFFGLTLLSALVVTATFFFYSRVAKLTLWDQAFLFPLLLYLVQPVNAVSFRGQQLSLLLIGVLFYIISFYPKKPKVLLLTIPLFFLWSNLHGQFIFGNILFFGWIVLYLGQKLINSLVDTPPNVIPTKVGIQSKKNASLINSGSRVKHGMTIFKGDIINKIFAFIRKDKKEIGYLFAVFLASGLAILINPFGFGVQTAAISHFGSPLLKNISEYLPFEMLTQPWINQLIVGVFVGASFVYLLLKGGLADRIPLLILSLIVYVLSLSVRRYAWPAYYMVLPMLQPLAEFLKPDNKKITYIMSVIFLVILLGMAIGARYPFTKYVTYDWNSYCASNSVSCSPKATEFMLKNKLTNNVYTLYAWGGYLIWNYPEIKPVIDGRMHLWKDEKGYSGFVDYYGYEQNFKDIDKSKYNVVYMSPDKPVYTRLEELVKIGKWKLVYKDEKAGVFVRLK